MENRSNLSRYKNVLPPVKIAKVDAGKVPTIVRWWNGKRIKITGLYVCLGVDIQSQAVLLRLTK